MSGKKSIVAIIGVLLVAAVAIVVFVLNGKPTFDLNEYLDIEVEGCDGYGTAELKFDHEELVDDLMKELELDKEDEWALMLLLDDNISGDLNKSENISNGDTISYTWDIDEKELEEELGCKFKCKRFEKKADGLTEAEKYNMFDDLVVTFEGVSPNGEINIDASNAKLELECHPEPKENFKNGDKVTITLAKGDNREMAQSYGLEKGYYLTELSREYTVEGLDTYVSELSEITEEVLNDMKNTAETAFKKNVNDNWAETESLKSMKHIGNYFLQKKADIDNETNNTVILVYQIDVSNSEGAFSYYYYTSFENLTLSTDGEVSADLENYTVPDAQYSWGYIAGEGFKHGHYYYDGYQDLDSLFEFVVGSHEDEFDYESTVQ